MTPVLLKRKIAVKYRRPHHVDLPHVVKFSGGRSSAAVAVGLAEAGVLNPDRGDVVLFANTSAEHPGTYDFAAAVSQLLEAEFSLPTLWFEFCTVEDARRGEYRRCPSYRLVRPAPVEDDPCGYRWRGEVFEEALSYQQMLPNPHQRSCTAKMKLQPSHQLLDEWFSGAGGPAHSGHYKPESYLTSEEMARVYRRNGGVAPGEKFQDWVSFMLAQPPNRPEQEWAEFTSAASAASPPVAVGEGLWGRPPTEHLTLLGLRADESRRIDRVMTRTLFAEGAGGGRCRVKNQPPGEHPYFPLADSNMDKNHVKEFWKSRSHEFDLDIPEGAGNCVFCFMKGTRDLVVAARSEDPRRVQETPSDFDWWANVERKYRREAPSRVGSGMTKFGFLGARGTSYAELVKSPPPPPNSSRYATGTPACDCTD